MKKKVTVLTKVLCAVILLSACGATPKAPPVITDSKEKASEVPETSNTKKADREELNHVAAIKQEKPKPPKPDITLPKLPYDKSKLPNVSRLDQMLMDEAWLDASYRLVYEEVRVLEEKTETAMSGTSEDIIRAIMTKVNGVNHFNDYALPIAEMAMEKFQEKYPDDNSFGELYWETYYAAEEEITGPVVDDGSHIIKDEVKRREVNSHFRNGYQPSITSDLRSLTELIEESKELTANVISSVLSQANIDMMVADYKKGKELTDLLNGTSNQLNLVKPLDESNAEVNAMLAKVEEKRASRIEEIKTALVEYRFPERYSAGNAPSNSSSLENKMTDFLSTFNYTSSEKYEVLEMKVAGPWIDIHHALTGAHLYSQIDFYVAVPSTDEGLVDVLLVTGKTGGPNHEAFGTYSVGGIGQMLPANL